LAELRKERAALALRKRASNTARAYASDWRDFAAWCELAGRRALPASSDSCQLYLVHLAQLGRLPATLERRVSAIGAQHAAAGQRSPVDVDVREVLAGMRRKLGAAPQHAKAAVTIPELRLMLRATPGDAVGARDRALLLVGFASGMRRGELASLNLADVRFEERGAVLALAKSKTDQAGVGAYVGVHKGIHAETCPIRALRAWLVERGAWPGALFCSVDNCGAIRRARMADKGIASAVKGAAAAAGLDASRFAAHSLRAGLVTAAGGAGVGSLAIMARTGHRSASVLERYMRPASALAVDPLRGLL
jgi:site-specific recombinase XerD